MSENTELPPENPSETLTFEQSLDRLEEIVHLLEEGKLGLTESLGRYEEGVKLLRGAYHLLEGAERKIELLSGLDADGNPITRSLEDVATLDCDANSEFGRRKSAGGKRKKDGLGS